jgi:outer membrane receptor for ferrienterochelin and colicin
MGSASEPAMTEAKVDMSALERNLRNLPASVSLPEQIAHLQERQRREVGDIINKITVLLEELADKVGAR